MTSFTQHQLQGRQSPFRECRLCNESQLSSFHDRSGDGFAWNFKNGLNLKVTYFIVLIAKLMPYQKTYFSTACRTLTIANRFTEVSHTLQTVLPASPKVEKKSSRRMPYCKYFAQHCIDGLNRDVT